MMYGRILVCALLLAGCADRRDPPVAASSGDPIHFATDSEWKKMDTRIRALEDMNAHLMKQCLLLSEAVGSIATFNITAADSKYQDIGMQWQVTSIKMTAHPQGCSISGAIMNKLYVVRMDVDFDVNLIDEKDNEIGGGSGTIKFASPGVYSEFNVVVITERKLSDAKRLRFYIHDSGQTSPVLSQ